MTGSRQVRTLLALGLMIVMMAFGATAQEAAPSLTLEVAEMGFGTGYDPQTRSLEGEGTVFPAGTETIYCRTRITGATEPTTVTHAWYRDGKTMARVELGVGSASWRTVSSKRLLPDWTGEWEVRVLDAAGTLLRSETFTVQ
ncbi:DUF2914 domain-containing protein [bacterium]|nr:DUF2914 domain-containing protein [bacterium]